MVDPDDTRRRDWGDDAAPPDGHEGGERRPPDHYDHPHRGRLILGLGIASIVACNLCPFAGFWPGAAAWVMGGGDLAAMDAGEMDPAGRSDTAAGRLCGAIGVGLNAVHAAVVAACLAVGLASRA